MMTDIDSPGLRPSRIFDQLDDAQAERLLSESAFRRLSVVAPDRIRGPRRSVTLGEILSLDRAIADRNRRTPLLDAVPGGKIAELEERVDASIERLRTDDSLSPVVQRALVGFFGRSTSAEPADTRPGEPEDGCAIYHL